MNLQWGKILNTGDNMYYTYDCVTFKYFILLLSYTYVLNILCAFSQILYMLASPKNTFSWLQVVNLQKECSDLNFFGYSQVVSKRFPYLKEINTPVKDLDGYIIKQKLLHESGLVGYGAATESKDFWFKLQQTLSRA